jgi:hypothetical protein
MPIDKALLEAIRAKAEADRSPAEVALLAAAEETSSSSADGIDWEAAFQHPRFKKLVEERNNAQTELKKLQDQALLDQNKYKELYESTKAELEVEKGRSGRADTLEGTLKKTLDAELAALTPEAKKLIPSKLPIEDQLDWIAANRASLTRQQARDIGAGGGRSMQNQKAGKPELSPEESRVAQMFGYTTEEYLKFRDMSSAEPFAASRKPQEETSETEPTE